MDMIQLPVKFDSTGIKKLKDGTEDYYSQLLSIALLTEPMTHPFTPQFGANDPAFRNIDKGLFVLTCARFIPEVKITSLTNDIDKSTGESRIAFSFQIQNR
jgi:hypothetical protein